MAVAGYDARNDPGGGEEGYGAMKTGENRSSGNVRYPGVKVTLVGEDGNAFAVMGRVRRALRKAGVAQDELDAFTREATSGDYDHLLATCMSWVDCV